MDLTKELVDDLVNRLAEGVLESLRSSGDFVCVQSPEEENVYYAFNKNLPSLSLNEFHEGPAILFSRFVFLCQRDIGNIDSYAVVYIDQQYPIGVISQKET